MRDPGVDALRAVMPLVSLGVAPAYVGPVMLVEHAGKLVGATSLDLLRRTGDVPLAVVTALDGSAVVPVTGWRAGRYQGIADPALGRPREVMAMAIGTAPRLVGARPRDTPVIAELLALDDLGRALIAAAPPEPRDELAQVAGEIVAPSS